MELYLANADSKGRDAVFAATEMLMAGLYLLNGAEGDGTDPTLAPYRSFAVQWGGTPGNPSDSQTPYSHMHDAVNGLRRMLAEMDGFRVDDVDTIVTVAADYTFDLMGESNPARRAYDMAVRNVIFDAWLDAEYDAEYDQLARAVDGRW